MLLTNKDILLKLEQLEKQVLQNSGDVELIFKTLRQLLLQPKEKRNQIGFKIGKKIKYFGSEENLRLVEFVERVEIVEMV